jgi:NADH dehydrogenase
MRDEIVTVFGGSGFLGRHIVQALAKRGWRIRVAVRKPDLAGFLQPLGRVGQIHAVAANLRVKSSVIAAAHGSTAIVNLVGVLAESGRQSFDAVHGFGAGAVADAARELGAGLVHMSAIGADPDSPSAYGRSKAAGEAAVRERVPPAAILRPSVVFGPEDRFFNRFAEIARMAPIMPVFGAATRLQPVFVGDIAEAVARILDGGGRPATTYELGGPDIKTMREIEAYVLAVTGRRRPLVDVPMPAARLLGSVLGLLPGAPLTADQVTMLEIDNVVGEAAIAEGRTLAGLGIEPVAVEAVVPTYLWRYRKTGQFDRERLA